MSAIPVAESAPPAGQTAVDWLLQRRRGPQTPLAIGIVLLSVALNVFHFYSTYFGQTEVHAHRSTHVALMLILAILLFPLGRRSFSDPLTWHFVVDLGAIAVALGSQVYTLVHLHRFVDPGYEATHMDVIVGTLLIVVVLEATRRTVSLGLTLTAVFFLLQTWHADHFFWIFYGPPTPWWTMVESFFGKEEGLYGIPVAIMSGVLILFIIFSAFLSTTDRRLLRAPGHRRRRSLHRRSRQGRGPLERAPGHHLGERRRQRAHERLLHDPDDEALGIRIAACSRARTCRSVIRSAIRSQALSSVMIAPPPGR